MNTSHGQPVGELVRARRKELGLSGYEVAAKMGVPRSTIFRLEHNQVRPSVETLDSLAGVLDLQPSELLASAGYGQLAALPTFTGYLRSKYPDMPTDARDDLAKAFQRIAHKHGFDPSRTSPHPGEDE